MSRCYNFRMIRHIDMTGINLELEEDFKKYVSRKIGRLERLIPRQARGSSVRAEVRLKEVNESNGNKYRCEASIYLPDETLAVTDSTMNMYAVIDIVEEKLKHSLRKYKDKHSNLVRIHGGGIMGRLKRQRGMAAFNEATGTE